MDTILKGTFEPINYSTKERAIERLKLLMQQKGWTNEMSKAEAKENGLCVRCWSEEGYYNKGRQCQSCKDDMAS